MKAVARAMGVARSNLVERLKPSVRQPPRPQPDDQWLVPKIRAMSPSVQVTAIGE